jgi:branched-chain amino acid transport system permease protein
VYWQFWIGAFLVVVVLLAPGGILGGVATLAARLQRRAR